MSTPNVPHNSHTPKASIVDLMTTLANTPPPPDTLAGSALDPTKGGHGMVAIQEAFPVALRRIGLLIAALSPSEALHPCVTPDELKATVVGELTELEAILERIQAEAETAAAATTAAA